MTTTAAKRHILFLETSQYHPIALGAIEYARRAGWAMMFSSQHQGTLAEMARNWKADGLIVGGPARSGTDTMRQWRRCPVPFVNMNEYLPERLRVASVLLDFRACGRLWRTDSAISTAMKVRMGVVGGRWTVDSGRWTVGSTDKFPSPACGRGVRGEGT